MALRRRVSAIFFFSALIFFLSGAPAPLHAQTPRPVNFLAVRYDVSASLDAIGQSISATAKIDFKAVEGLQQRARRTAPNLVVKEVKGRRRQAADLRARQSKSAHRDRPTSHARGHRRPHHSHLRLLGPARKRREQPRAWCPCRPHQQRWRLPCCSPPGGSLTFPSTLHHPTFPERPLSFPSRNR